MKNRKVIRKVRRRRKRPKALPKPEGADHKRDAIVMIGDGIGNVVEQTPLVKAVISMYANVDVWCPRTNVVDVTIIKDMPGVRSLMRHGQTPTAKYDACFTTFLVKRLYKKVNAACYYHAGQPTKVNEAHVCLNAARKAGWDDKSPLPYCCTEKCSLKHPVGTKLIGIAPGGKSRAVWRFKRYPYWQSVVDILGLNNELHFALLGRITDDNVVHEQLTDYRDKLKLPESAYVASQCDLMLANDCGMAHVAAALGVPTIVVFGPTRIIKNLPQHNALPLSLDLDCQPCQYSRKGIGRRRDGSVCSHECMQGLAPQLIVDRAIQELTNDGK